MTNTRKKTRSTGLSHAVPAALLRLAALVAPRYVERRIAHAFLTPRRRRIPAQRAALPPADQSIRVRIADGSGEMSAGETWVAAWRWGEGPAVMVVHGWEDDHRTFAPMIAALRARGQAVIAFDLPGHGGSGGRTAILPTIARAITEIAAILGPVEALAGHSFGGAAVTLALAQGFAVERAAILAAPVSIARALELVTQRIGLSPDRRAGIGRELHRRTGVTVESLELEPMAARLDVPALIVHSRDDRMVPARSSERLARAWTGAELALVDGLGHRRILSDPAMLERILGFLAPLPQIERAAASA